MDFGQQTAQPLTRRLLVVHQQRPNLRGGRHRRTLLDHEGPVVARGRSRAELADLGECRVDDLPRRQRRVPAEDGDQAVHAKFPPVRRGRLGQAVGVHRQQIAGGERDGSLGERRVGGPADDRTRRVEHPDVSVRREHDGGRVAGVGVGQRRGLRIEGAEEDRGEAVRLDGAGGQPVQFRHHRGGGVIAACSDGLQARLHRSGEQPGIHAFARHVAERDAQPPAGERQKIVVVPADAVRGHAHAGRLEAGFSGRGGRHQPHLRPDGFAPLARGALLVRDLDADPLDGPRQPVAVHRLQQVVDRVQLERVDGEPVVGGAEDDPRARGLQPRRHLETRERRHLDVEEHEIGRQGVDARDRFEAVLRFADDLDLHVSGRQQPAQPVACRRLVVHDQRPDHRTCSTAGCGRGSCRMNGSDTDTVVRPAAASRSTVSAASDWK